MSANNGRDFLVCTTLTAANIKTRDMHRLVCGTLSHNQTSGLGFCPLLH